MLTWAHGMLAHEDEGLTRACVKEIRDRLGEFNTRDLTNTAWALDALGVRASDKPKLVERFGRGHKRRTSTRSTRRNSSSFWARSNAWGEDAKLAHPAMRARRNLRAPVPRR